MIFNLRKKLIHKDFIIGIIVCLSFPYPSVPFYPFAYLLLLYSIPYIKFKKKDLDDILLLGVFFLIIVIVNFFNANFNLSVIGTYSMLLMFLVRYSISNYDNFFYGILLSTSIYSFITIFLFFDLNVYLYGLDVFTNSSYRMWGEGYLLEWPNVFACFIIIGGFLSFYYSKKTLLFLHIVASILTTSRASLIFILFVFIIIFIEAKNKKLYFTIFLIIFSLLFLLLINQEELLSRITKFSDRSIIFYSLIEVFKDNFFGIGNVSFSNFDTYYESYHSSFLKVLVRYGLLGLLIYIILLFPKNFKYNNLKINFLILFLLVSGIFQDFLFHPHILIIYTILINFKGERIR